MWTLLTVCKNFANDQIPKMSPCISFHLPTPLITMCSESIMFIRITQRAITDFSNPPHIHTIPNSIPCGSFLHIFAPQSFNIQRSFIHTLNPSPQCKLQTSSTPQKPQPSGTQCNFLLPLTFQTLQQFLPPTASGVRQWT